MQPKALRIARENFKKLLQSSHKKRGSFVVLHYRPSQQAKIAVVVPKKVARSAVQRHRYKRIIIPLLSSNTKHEVVVRMFRKPNSEQELREDVLRLVKSI